MSVVETRILERVDAMSPTETRVARAILSAYPALATRSASEIARAAGASTASVTRFVARLDFTNFKDFHDAVRTDLDVTAQGRAPSGDSPHRDNLIAAVSDIELRNVTATLDRLTEETLEQVRSTIADASEVAILGGRFSHALAIYLHAHLQVVRPDVTLVSRANVPDQIAHHGRGSCLVVFDFPQYQPDAEHAVRYTKSRRGRALVITDPLLSPASHHADFTLVADVEGPHPAISSLVAPIALIDAIVTDIITSGEDLTQQRIARVHAAREMFWSLPTLPRDG